MPLLIAQGRPLLALALVLVAGILGGRLIKLAKLPAVTGQILAGVMLSVFGAALFDKSVVQDLQPVTHFALGLITLTVGTHLDVRRLRHAGRRLAWLLLFECTLTPLLVFGSVWLLAGQDPTMALLLAALAISTAPASIVAVVKETHSEGIFVKTLVAAVALNNIACILLFEAARTAAGGMLHPEGGISLLGILWAPLPPILGAALLGGGCGVLLVLVTRRVVRPEQLATATILALLLAVGFSDALGLSPLLSCLFLGLSLANLTPHKDEVIESAFSNLETIAFAAFFTLAGMHLDFGHMREVALLSLLVVLARILGKYASGRLAMKLAGATAGVRRYLGLALIPQAGVAVGLMLIIQDDPLFSTISASFLAVGLTSVTLNEICGPILTRVALTRSGDFGKHRPRLIDFLKEESIVTNLEAGSQQEAMARLCGVLIRANHLKVEPEALLARFLEREEEISSCLGEGLAIPHITLEKGVRILGAMGISAKGLPFETPDGVPVHCMVLLVTPRAKRAKHLEILAALARAIGGDRNIRRQLYHATSPAHAYELLHAEEAEVFNYFLEEDRGPSQREPLVDL